MSNSPIQVTTDLKDYLQEFKGSLEKMDVKLDRINDRLTTLEIGQARLEAQVKGDIKALDEKVTGLGKRLENQEFVNRGILVALTLLGEMENQIDRLR